MMKDCVSACGRVDCPNVFKPGDRVHHIGTPDRPGEVCFVETKAEHGEDRVCVRWDVGGGCFHDPQALRHEPDDNCDGEGCCDPVADLPPFNPGDVVFIGSEYDIVGVVKALYQRPDGSWLVCGDRVGGGEFRILKGTADEDAQVPMTLCLNYVEGDS